MASSDGSKRLKRSKREAARDWTRRTVNSTDNTSVIEAESTPSASSPAAAAPSYFPRRLRLHDEKAVDYLDETGLLAFSGPRVVLGEPGMGKSELMREVGRQLGVEPVTAIRFINAKNPAKLVPVGKPVLIDGLDEAMSRREGDAVDAILAQLEAANSPPFILSCRSREWQARSVTNLRQLYGAD